MTLNKSILRTFIGLSLATSGCEVLNQNTKITENPALCETYQAPVNALREGIKQTRFLNYKSKQSLLESIRTEKLNVADVDQTLSQQEGSSLSNRISIVRLPN